LQREAVKTLQRHEVGLLSAIEHQVEPGRVFGAPGHIGPQAKRLQTRGLGLYQPQVEVRRACDCQTGEAIAH
jgi:hypothetical protein